MSNPVGSSQVMTKLILGTRVWPCLVLLVSYFVASGIPHTLVHFIFVVKCVKANIRPLVPMLEVENFDILIRLL